MLITPEVFRNFNYLGVDPGLSQCGVSVFSIREGELASIDAFTLINNKLREASSYDNAYHAEKVQKLDVLLAAWRQVLRQYLPVLVCCESPFYNPLMPGAYGSLTATVTALQLEVLNYSSVVPFVQYAPQVVKQVFKRSGQVGKIVMREALMADDYLRSKLTSSVELLDEHSIDATAVGYKWLKDQQ